MSLITEWRKLLYLTKGCLFSIDKRNLMNVRMPDFILAEDVVLLFVSTEIVETFIFPLTPADWTSHTELCNSWYEKHVYNARKKNVF